MQQRDIFICHASEDKEKIVGPMVEAFDRAGLTYWYDEAEIDWGDSITQKVNEGLSISRYVLVIVSEAFVGKHWPERELNGVLNREASSGDVKVLPLLVGSVDERERILAKYPLLNDKRYLPWDGDPQKIANALLARTGKKQTTSHPALSPRSNSPTTRDIPLPKIKKNFTQRDKDLFLRNAFASIRAYFKDALIELGRADQDIETDFMEVHSFKFICTVYVRGEVASRCKIWLGGLASSDAIAYHAGNVDINSDNAFSDLLSVLQDDQRLGFGFGWFGGGADRAAKPADANQAAEYLWRKFIDNLR